MKRMTSDRRATDNKGLPNIAGASVIESICYKLSLLRVDSFVRLSPATSASPKPLPPMLKRQTTQQDND